MGGAQRPARRPDIDHTRRHRRPVNGPQAGLFANRPAGPRLQRPRLPGWLADELGHDRRLLALATRMLVWAGVSRTAASEAWPYQTWARERGDNLKTVARDVQRVLAAMAQRPAWFEKHVERPLGSGLGDPDEVDPRTRLEAELQRLAADAVTVLGSRLGSGGDTRAVVDDVIRDVFGGPSAALADPATMDRIVATIQAVIGEAQA